MSDVDPKVSELNASVDERLTNYLSNRGRMLDAAVHARMRRSTMAEHQPEGGKWGAPCQAGEHEQPAPWPCEVVQSLDTPLAYLD